MDKQDSKGERSTVVFGGIKKKWTRLEIDKEETGKRLDSVVARAMDGCSRSYIQKLIKGENVLVSGEPQKPGYRITGMEEIMIHLPDPLIPDIVPIFIPLDILYEDGDLIIINKERGRVVHPAPGHWNDTLVNGLLYHCKGELSGINGVLRPGIVHRIDKDTSGVIIVCKNDKAHLSIANQLREHSLTRKYDAIVRGHLKEGEGTVDLPLNRSTTDRIKRAVDHVNGKRAVTHYRVLETLKKDMDYIECRLETGRTHQIRVHMAAIGHPLLGDNLYGSSKANFGLEGQALHAKILGFIHPSTGKYMEFSSEMPGELKNVLAKLR